jgi:hypothetical protein
MKNFIAGVSRLGIIGSTIFLALAILSGVATVKLVVDIIGGIFNSPPTAGVASSPTVLQGIRQLGSLTSTSAQLATADLSINIRWGIGNVCSATAHHISQGTIEAGVDLTKITTDQIKFDEFKNEYTLTLPSPTLTNCIIDPVSTRQYQVTGTSAVCTTNRDELRRLASYEALIKFRDDAIQGGILERAQRDTDLLLSSFLAGLSNGATVNIIYEESEGINYPITCSPTPPEPWIFDENINRWKKD